MKKVIALLVVMAFVIGIASVAYAVSPAKIKSYINQLEQKLAEAKKNQNWNRVKILESMIASEKNRLAEAEGIAAPKPTVEVPKPAPKMEVKAKEAPLFGLGIPVCGEVGLLSNQSILGVRADVILPEPLGLAAWIGLPAQSLMYKVGIGYSAGTDNNGHRVKAVPLYADGVLMLPAELLDGINSYVGGGINYIVYRTGQKSGSLGGQIFAGIIGDTGLVGIGKTYAQVSYTLLRSGTAADDSISTRGVGVSVGQTIVL